MSGSQDEARAARIQKYKEERRKQLTARTATLFSANVTERRPRKLIDRQISEDTNHLKASSDLSLDAASASVPIRSTRTSRLRAAAAQDSTGAKRSIRSSSVNSLAEDAKNRTPRSARVIERDKRTANRRQSREEKENVKTSSIQKDIGATKTKPKHSIVKLDKDKSKILVISPKEKNENGTVKTTHNGGVTNLEEEKDHVVNLDETLKVNGDEILEELLNDSTEKDQFEDLFNDLLEEKVQDAVTLNLNDGVPDHLAVNVSVENGLNSISQKVQVPLEDAVKTPEFNVLIKENWLSHQQKKDQDPVLKTPELPPQCAVEGSVSVVSEPVNGQVSQLSVTCVRKVERFSELLSNLCSPCEADVLFEDILVENGLDSKEDMRLESPARAPPCRRAQPSPRVSCTPKRTPAATSIATATAVETGSVNKAKPRSPVDAPHPKTETAQSSSRVSPKSAFNFSLGKSASKLISTSSKPIERRRSSDSETKPSGIPLSKRSTEKLRHSISPVKQDLARGDGKPKQGRLNKTPDKSKSEPDTRNERRHRAHKDSENVSEKYHYFKKRLTSLENNLPKHANDATKTPPKLNGSLKTTESKPASEVLVDSYKVDNMTLHETRPHAGGSRLSQEMDSLAALTKQTLDRVNKLSNNLASSKLNLDASEPHFDTLFATTSEGDNYGHSYNYGPKNEKTFHRGVDERLKDIDTAAQRLIDFEKQNAMFSDLSNDTSSQNDTVTSLCMHTPVSILKRKSVNEDPTISNNIHQAIASPPVTFSPNVIEPRNSRSDNRRQGILKKRRSLDESQVARQRSCSPEVSFAEDGSSDTSKPILKNRRSSLEDVLRNQSPDGQIQGILKRKMSREEELYTNDDLSHGSPEPHGILKRKSNSSSSSSTASSHVSIAQAVLLAAAGGAEIVDDDKETVRPILKKKSFSEERPCLDILLPDTPKPILKKKSLEHDEYDFELPKKPILKLSKRLSGDEGHGSSFEQSEDDRSSRRPSLLRSRTSDHSGSECEATVKPILKQRGSSLTRERSQSPRPRLSFCADSDAISVTSFSADADEAGPSRLQAAPDPEESASANYPSAVLRRRNLRPKNSPRSKSLACDVNNELLSILNNRRQKVEENCDQQLLQTNQEDNEEESLKTFPSIADRIRSMEEALANEPVSPRDQPSISKSRTRDRGDRYKTQPITVEEMRLITSSLETGQAGFQAFGPIGSSFPSRPVELGAPTHRDPHGADAEPFLNFPTLDSPPFGANYFNAKHSDGLESAATREDSFGEATFLDFENCGVTLERRQSTLDEIEQEVNRVRVALDEDSRALEEDERQQAEADNWSLNVSCDSGVYNRASSRDSGPHSGEELGLIESQEIKENHASNSSSEWSTLERGLITMDRQRRSTEVEDRSPNEQGSDDDGSSGFALGLVKSNSVVARASMWQQLQQQAKGTPKPLLRHRSKANKDSVADRFKTQPIDFQPVADGPAFGLAQSKSTANVLDKDEDAKLDEDDPAKLSLMEKMKMFNSRLTHKPPVAGLPKPKEERSRGSRLRTMPVLASQVQEAMENNERLTKSFTHDDVPRNPNFQMKMELFRSASAKNTSLEYIMRQNKKFRSLDMYDDDTPTDRAERMITPEVRGILKSGTTVVPDKHKTLAKGESSEGLKDEGIDSSSDDESASATSVSSSEKSCSSSDSSDDIPGPKPRRFQARKSNKLKGSKTDSDLTRVLKTQDNYPNKTPVKIQDKYLPVKTSPIKIQESYQPIKTTPTKIQDGYHPIKTSPAKIQETNQPMKSSPMKMQEGYQPMKTSPSKVQDGFPPMKTSPMKVQLPCANELKERLNQAKNSDVKIPLLGKLKRSPEQPKKTEDEMRFKRLVTKDEPIQLGKLRRPPEKLSRTPLAPKAELQAPQVLKISALNQEAKNKFFGLEPKREKSIDELAAAVRRFIPPMSKLASTMEVQGSGSDGESSGGREVRHINTRSRNRAGGGGGGGGIQRSATHADMPNRGGTIAERLAALQAAGANDWRARVCRLSPEADEKDKEKETKAIERAKNRINESLNTAVDESKKIQIDDNEVGSNILADRRNKLETAAQGWRKRVPQSDANLFTVAGRLERDKVVTTSTPPLTPPPVAAPPAPASPGIPTPNKFRSRKPPTSPTNGFASGPLRSASCAVVSAAINDKPRTEGARPERDAFKRSHSVTESISRLDEKDEPSPGAEKCGSTVRVPRADDETFQAFFTPVLEKQDLAPAVDLDMDLDAIDSGSRQLLASDWTRRAKRERKQAGSRNPLKALAARTDIREEYSPPPSTNIREQLIKEKATANCGLAAEALAALATKEDFSNVALRSAAAAPPIAHGTKSLMLLHVKGRRRVQTRLVEPVHTSVNRGDCCVLVTPDQVFLYIGQYCNVIERNRSTDIALHIHTTKDLGCVNSSTVITIDEQNKFYSTKHWNQFWSLLGITDKPELYKPAETGHPDEDEIYESCIIQTNMCYEVMDDELVPIKEYWGQVPKIAMLHQSKVIVFDFGAEMYIWYGKNVPLESRRRAAQLAQELFDEGYNYEDCHINPLNAAVFQGARDEIPTAPAVKTSKKRPEWAILSKVVQHMETILFKEKFLDWPDYTRVIQVKHQENKTNSVEITPCDAEEMWANEYQDPDLILEGSHVGRGTHYYDKESMRHFEIRTKSVCKWVIQENDYQKVENDSEIGDFYSGDSYIIRWEYQINATGRELNGKPSKHNLTGRDRCAYFCWQGKDASSNEKGTAALLTVELDKEKGPQIRVVQGNEPPAFLNLFQGNLIIHQGKKDVDKSRYKLFITRGNLSNEAYLLQVPCSVRQLRSRGSLLLVDTEKGCLYIWHGARSLKHTKNIAIELANKLIARESVYLFGQNASKVKINEVKEGEEPKEVLEALGSNKQYYNSVLNGGKDLGADVTPRLFHFTDLGGHFEANEVLSPLRHEHLITPFPFQQKELYAASQPALFLLDDGQAVWLWQGWWPRGEDGELEPAERNAGVGAFAARWQAMRAAALRTAESYWRVSRSTRPDVRIVAAGLEPQRFTDLFDDWREHDEAADANIAHGYKAGEILSGACELSRLTSCDAIVPLAALQRRPLPDHVDPQHLERHLSSPDFLEAFGMTKEDFSVLPAWKQTNMKKEIGLF